MRTRFPYRRFTDSQVTEALDGAAANERRSAADFIECLEEFDRRQLHLVAGFSSLYGYCQQRLRLSEDAAYKRIELARAYRRHPHLLEMLDDGRLSLTTACMIVKSARGEKAEALMAEAAFKSKRAVELILATQDPKPVVPAVIRKLPDPPAVPVPHAACEEPTVLLAELAKPPACSSSRRPVVAPLSEAHYKLQVTISAVARDRLKQIQDLMWHRLPNGDPAAIVEHALEVLHAQLLKEKAAIVAKPRTGKSEANVKGRYIPASVKRAVFRRDQGKCAFVAPDGSTCGSTSGVEFHHVQPYAAGGDATIENIEMRCRAHNGFEWTRHLDQETEHSLAAESQPSRLLG